jgi:hypothetical protein
MIPREEHPEPEAAWKAMEEFIAGSGRMPDGAELSPSFVKVLAVGAWIGCRLSAIYPPFGLAVAEWGNAQADVVFTSVSQAFNETYIEWLGLQMDNYAHNIGFTDLPVKVMVVPNEPEDVSEGLTDEDAKQILGGLDDLFGGKQRA